MAQQYMTPEEGRTAAHALVQSVADPEQFNRFSVGVQGVLCRMASRWLSNEQDVLDAVQDVLVNVYLNRGRYDPSRDLAGWLWVIVRNACIDILRRNGATLPPLAEEDGGAVPEPSVADAADWRMKWEAAWNGLTPAEQTLLDLYCIQKIGTYAKCAGELGISVQTFTMRLHYAKEHLRKLLQEQGVVS